MSRIFSRHLFVKTNLSCNLNCIYCYDRNKSNRSFDEVVTLNKLEQVLKEKTENGTKIKLVGGEPFLVFPKIKRLCEALWSMSLEEQIHIQITTNGTLVHDEIQDWLYENRAQIDCKLSIDGDRNSQECNRPHSFDKIDILFFVNTWPDGSINMVITPQTIHNLADNIIFLHECGFKNIMSLFAILTDWKDCYCEREYYSQLIELVDFYLNNPQFHRFNLLNNKIERTLNTSYDKPLCEVGRKIVYDIESDRYYPCHLFFPSVCGEISQKEIESFDFATRSHNEEPQCLSCKFINICHTCYAANYIERGALSKRDMTMCAYRKLSFLATAKLEYSKIIVIKEPSSTDILKMKAIQYLLEDLNIIENNMSK